MTMTTRPQVTALMLVRNEDWIFAASLRAALAWCDNVFVMLHNCTDHSGDIVAEAAYEFGDRITTEIVNTDRDDGWREMDLRQSMFERAKMTYPTTTHFALVDADEMLTGNFAEHMPNLLVKLSPGQVLDLPMIVPVGNMGNRRIDRCVWTTAKISTAFGDGPGLSWSPRGTYQHHARAPRPESAPRVTLCHSDIDGGVHHCQWLSRARLTAKHALYKMVEVTRYPGRRTVEEIERIFSMALDTTNREIGPMPAHWLTGFESMIAVNQPPTEIIAQCQALLDEHGRDAFAGLNLFGVI